MTPSSVSSRHQRFRSPSSFVLLDHRLSCLDQGSLSSSAGHTYTSLSFDLTTLPQSDTMPKASTKASQRRSSAKKGDNRFILPDPSVPEPKRRSPVREHRRSRSGMCPLSVHVCMHDCQINLNLIRPVRLGEFLFADYLTCRLLYLPT